MPAVRRKRCKQCGRLPKKSMKGGDTQTNELYDQLQRVENDWADRNDYYRKHAPKMSATQKKQFEKGLTRLRAKRSRVRQALDRSQDTDITSRADTDTEE